MGLCNVECIKRIAQYLDVSIGELEVSDKNIIYISKCEKNMLSKAQGFSTIVQALVRMSEGSDIYNSDKEVEALIQQWLEYIVICVNHADVATNVKKVLNELNTILRDVPYVTGRKKTIVDVTLYYILHSIMKVFSLQQKAQYVHVSRWFDNIQQEEELRRELDLISFNLLHLFL